MIIGRSIWPPDFIITAKSVLHGRTVMDKETMMYLCIAIGVALAMLGGAKFIRAWIKAEKEIKKRK